MSPHILAHGHSIHLHWYSLHSFSANFNQSLSILNSLDFNQFRPFQSVSWWLPTPSRHKPRHPFFGVLGFVFVNDGWQITNGPTLLPAHCSVQQGQLPHQWPPSRGVWERSLATSGWVWPRVHQGRTGVQLRYLWESDVPRYPPRYRGKSPKHWQFMWFRKFDIPFFFRFFVPIFFLLFRLYSRIFLFFRFFFSVLVP